MHYAVGQPHKHPLRAMEGEGCNALVAGLASAVQGNVRCEEEKHAVASPTNTPRVSERLGM